MGDDNQHLIHEVAATEFSKKETKQMFRITHHMSLLHSYFIASLKITMFKKMNWKWPENVYNWYVSRKK